MQHGPNGAVMFVTRVRYFGGSTVSLRSVLRHLGRDVPRVLAAPEGGTVAPALRDEGLVDSYVPIPRTRGGWILRIGTAVVAAVRLAGFAFRHRKRLAAVHANGLADAVIAALAARVAGAQLVVWVHDTNPVSRRSARLVPAVRWTSRRTRWAAVSQVSADALIEAGLVDRGEVVVVPNPIDCRRLPRRPDNGPIYVGYLGTDTSVKGFDLLPAVMLHLGGADIRLLVFARRHEGIAPELERAWDTLGADRRVELVGRQDDPEDAYRRCDIVLCPSRAESFCRVAAEAMASGVPVVGASIPALRLLLGDGDAGLLFASEDPAAAAAALRRMAGDPDLRQHLAVEGVARARSFDGASVTARLTTLYFPSAA